MVSNNKVFINRLLFKHHDSPWFSLICYDEGTVCPLAQRDVAVQSNEVWRVGARIYGSKRKFTILLHFLHSYQWVKLSFLHIYFISLHCCVTASIHRLPRRVNIVVINLDGSPVVLIAFMIVSSWASLGDWLSSSSLRSTLLGCVGLNVLLSGMSSLLRSCGAS